MDPNKPSRWVDIISVHQIEKVPLIEVKSVQIGGHQVEKVAVTILSLPTTMKIDGLLGVNVLRRFRATFEFDQATLILR